MMAKKDMGDLAFLRTSKAAFDERAQGGPLQESDAVTSSKGSVAKCRTASLCYRQDYQRALGQVVDEGQVFDYSTAKGR